MNASFIARAARAALALPALAGLVIAAPAARAAIKDYRFELVGTTVEVGSNAVITARLVDSRTGQPIPDAIVFAMRLDMAPGGMQDMAATITALPSPGPGLYRFRAPLGMAGDWRLSLAAKVQGDEGTVDDQLIVKVVAR